VTRSAASLLAELRAGADADERHSVRVPAGVPAERAEDYRAWRRLKAACVRALDAASTPRERFVVTAAGCVAEGCGLDDLDAVRELVERAAAKHLHEPNDGSLGPYGRLGAMVARTAEELQGLIADTYAEDDEQREVAMKVAWETTRDAAYAYLVPDASASRGEARRSRSGWAR
jgi:hypothetical protein